jgi:hypothetical protein
LGNADDTLRKFASGRALFRDLTAGPGQTGNHSAEKALASIQEATGKVLKKKHLARNWIHSSTAFEGFVVAINGIKNSYYSVCISALLSIG